MKIIWTTHAREKLRLLRAHGVALTEDLVEGVLRAPDRVMPGYRSRLVAQGSLDEHHVLRVVYEEAAGERKIVTLYPGRRERYEAS